MQDERKRKRALRDELRNFYLQQQQQPEPVHAEHAVAVTAASVPSASKGQTGAAATHDLDSPSFKASAYMRHILKSQTLPELLRSDADLMKGARPVFLSVSVVRAH